MSRIYIRIYPYSPMNVHLHTPRNICHVYPKGLPLQKSRSWADESVAPGRGQWWQFNNPNKQNSSLLDEQFLSEITEIVEQTFPPMETLVGGIGLSHIGVLFVGGI